MSRLGAGYVATLLVTAAWLPGVALAEEAKKPAASATPAAAPGQGQHADEEDPREAIKEKVLRDTPNAPAIETGPEGVAKYTEDLRQSSSDRTKMSAGKALAGMAAAGD